MRALVKVADETYTEEDLPKTKKSYIHSCHHANRNTERKDQEEDNDDTLEDRGEMLAVTDIGSRECLSTGPFC